MNEPNEDTGHEVDGAWVWPCGCTVTARPAFKDLLCVSCSIEHDDALDALCQRTADRLNVPVNRIYPSTN